MHTHNHLLEWYPGLDGIKTGFVNASGFNLAASAVRDGHRLIGVIMGGRSARGRDVQMASLLDQGFAVLAARGSQPETAPAAPAAPPAQPQAAPLVAAAPAATTAPSAAAAPAVATMQVPVAVPATHVAAAQAGSADAEGMRQRYGFLGNVAKHLAPVAKAEASPLAREATAAGEGWAIQIGAFRSDAAAEQAARRVAVLAVVKGKPQQILAPAKTDASRLYRARLLHFTSKGAQAACDELHRRGIACSIVRPAGMKVASE